MHNRTLPKTDRAFATWSANLIQKLAADYEAYGITHAMYDDAVASHAAFATAFATATNPMTRTSAAITGKDDAAAAWRRVAGQVVAVVRAQRTVSDAERVLLGLPPRATNTVIGALDRAPLLVVLGVDSQTVRLLASDSEATRRGRPATAAGLVLFSHVGTDAPNDIRDWRYEGTSSSVTLSVTFDAALPIGQPVWFSAQWLSPRLEAGPTATPVYAHLTYGVHTSTRGLRRAA